MSDFAPGELALKVQKDPDCGECGSEAHGPKNGRVYRVASVRHERHWRYQGLALADFRAGTSRSGLWCACNFRKVDPASESFIETVRACRPIRQREPA